MDSNNGDDRPTEPNETEEVHEDEDLINTDSSESDEKENKEKGISEDHERVQKAHNPYDMRKPNGFQSQWQVKATRKVRNCPHFISSSAFNHLTPCLQEAIVLSASMTSEGRRTHH